jgi:anti-sigma factor RsiW
MPELHLLTGAYALDALDDVERAGFERHLRDCPTCAIEVIEFRESAAALADRVAAPAPIYLRAAVLAEIGRTRQVSPGRVTLPRFSLRRTLAVAAAAVVIAGSAGLGGVAYQSHRAAQTATAQAGAIAQVMTDPGRSEVVGEATGGGRAAVVAARGSAVFAASKLPALPKGKQYQLWRIRGKDISSEGLLKLSSGTGQALVSGISLNDFVAISVEPLGGSKQPTTTPILSLQVV